MLRLALAAWSVVALSASAAWARGGLAFDDPAGDDHGAGAVVYPTDPVFAPGTFDLRQVTLDKRGRDVEIRLTFAAPVTDPWNSRAWGGPGWSLPLVHVYLDTARGGYQDTLPGVGARFAQADRWDRVVVVSAEGGEELKRRLRQLKGFERRALVRPRSLTVDGATIVARVRKSALGRSKVARWGVQVVVGSTDVFAEGPGRPWRAVQARAGAFRFGGGDDRGCDPNVIDVLAPDVATQRAALASRCDGADGGPLPMMRR